MTTYSIITGRLKIAFMGLIFLAGISLGLTRDLVWLEECDVVWDTPSEDSFGSMPLGNGDIGLNVWVEPSGDLLFYVSKVDAYDANHTLPKLGRVRLRFDPAMPVIPFRQTLRLEDGAIFVEGGDVKLRLWVDANSPVIRVEGASASARKATVAVESVSPLRKLVAIADANADLVPPPGKLPASAGFLLDDGADRLIWGFRNTTSVWIDRVRSQNSPEMIKKAEADDPILNRTSGCQLQGKGFVRESVDTLALKEAVTEFDITLNVDSSRTPTAADWIRSVSRSRPSDWNRHRQWWRAFWERSRIVVEGCGKGPVQLDQLRYSQNLKARRAFEGHREIEAETNARQITQRYALERFQQAACGRGQVPPPFNGLIFTMDMPAGTRTFAGGPSQSAATADKRDWFSLPFMWQNTRHPYWSMGVRGDFDLILPGMQFVRDGLEICKDRTRTLFGHEGAFVLEASYWHNVGALPTIAPHLLHHFIATIELPAIMCDYYAYTQDPAFFREILLPCADEFLKFFELHFPARDSRGKMIMAPAGVAESYRNVVNPNTEIAGLRYVLEFLLGLDEELIGSARKADWSRLLGLVPEVPLKQSRGVKLLGVADRYDPAHRADESAELYTVWPFRQVWIGRPDRLALARQSFHVKNTSVDGMRDMWAVETGGWQSAPVQAAHLGLAREAARLTSINFHDRFIHWHDDIDPDQPWPYPARPRPRFPSFWENKMDYTPDGDHGANSANALQSMLLQSDGKKIFLLPAWHEDWDVSFKLHAFYGTTVECVYRDGKVRSLKVTPASRAADIIDMSSADNRIRTLVSVACVDRNYLFSLPPMLDGLPQPGPVTAPWLARYGECLTDVRAAPWPDSVFKDNLLYVFGFDGRAPQAPAVPAELRSSEWITEKDKLTPVQILKLEYDRPLAPFAWAAPYEGSLTTGAKATARSIKPGNEPGKAIDANAETAWHSEEPKVQRMEIDFGKPVTFNRVELLLDNPDFKKGKGIRFDLSIPNETGAWKPFFRGDIYGQIFGKTFDPVTATGVQIVFVAPSIAVRQFDLFETAEKTVSVPVPDYLSGHEQAYRQNPREAALDWFREAKFGMFVTYGMASLLPQGKVGPWPDEPTEEMRASFTAEQFDADSIAELAKKAGMRYICLTAFHGGGPFLWGSDVAHPNTLTDLPARRDLLGELAKACRANGLGLFIYVHWQIAQSHPDVWARNQAIFREWLTRYGPIAGFWFDTDSAYRKNPDLYPHLGEIYGMIRERQPQALISFCGGVTGHEDYITYEHYRRDRRLYSRVIPEDIERRLRGKPVEVCTTMQLNEKNGKGVRMWFNVEGAYHRTADEIWDVLSEVRRDNVNLLLNIGLLGNGSIHPADAATLQQVGQRLSKEGFPVSKQAGHIMDEDEDR